jgi:branched-chain amino acid aminotransferase
VSGSPEGERPGAATRPRWVAIEGERVDPERAFVSIFDRGLLYGDGVFETMRAERGRVHRLDEHLQRLAWSCERVGIVPTWTSAALRGEVERFVDTIRDEVDRTLFTSAPLALRVFVTRGAGPLGLDPEGADAPLRFAIAEPLRALPPAAYAEGVAVVTWATHRASDAARGAKVTSYLESILALRHARSRGAHEALIVDGAGWVLEGATSSLFAVRGGALETPPLDDRVLPGITRRAVLEAARARATPIVERRLALDDLASADELFVTSSLRGLLPVVEVDGHRVGTGRPGPRWAALARSYGEREDLPVPDAALV